MTCQVEAELSTAGATCLGFASSGYVRGPAMAGMTTANSGASFSREKRCGGGEESWGSGTSADGSILEGASRRMKKKFVPPVCNCESYAILFKSGTSKNPRRLFFGCSYFRNNTGHCKYFAWLDEYVASFCIDEVVQDGVSDPTKKMEERIEEIEKKMDEVKSDDKNSGALSRWKVFGLILLGIVIEKGM
ncbi:GRF zinc finger protein [Arachis hypogaea]|nr:GRF zinc finger protein [Arachis hypogaea]